MKLLLAVDQATALTGYALYQDKELKKHGKIKIDGEPIERIAQVKAWLSEMIDALTFNKEAEIEVVLEDIQMQVNYETGSKVYGQGNIGDVKTFKTLAHLQGVLLVLLHEKGIKYRVFLASEWKSGLGIKGKGRTEQKQNTQAYVKESLNIKASQDECDAICIGLHAIKLDDSVVNWG